MLTAIEHVSTSPIGMADELINLITYGTPHAYACPNVSTHASQVRQSIPIPGWMRAPGEAEGSFAMESAIDELSYALGIDPIELRVKNHAHVHPDSGLLWSSNALLDCYRQGAERFGWSARTPQPRSTQNQGQLVGFGMDAPCCDVFRLKNGKIESFNCYPSGTIILGQLGVLSA